MHVHLGCPGAFLVLTIIALAAPGCALGSVKTINGATYDLSGAESVLADRIEAQDPKGAPIEVRCDYWRRQRIDLNASPRTLTQRAGVVGTTNYESLRNWAAQIEQIACAPVAEKRAKQEAARREELEAKREEEREQREAQVKEAQARAATIKAEKEAAAAAKREEEARVRAERAKQAQAACAKGDQDECAVYAASLVQSDPVQAEKIATKGCKTFKNAHGCAALALVYLAQDKKADAFRLAKAACDAGEQTACTMARDILTQTVQNAPQARVIDLRANPKKFEGTWVTLKYLIVDRSSLSTQAFVKDDLSGNEMQADLAADASEATRRRWLVIPSGHVISNVKAWVRLGGSLEVLTFEGGK